MNGRAEITSRILELWHRRELSAAAIRETLRREFPVAWSVHDAGWTAARQEIEARLLARCERLAGRDRPAT